MKKRNSEKYINFPIQLIDGFMVQSDSCLKNILSYAFVSYLIKRKLPPNDENIRIAEDYFGIGNGEGYYSNGKELIDSLPHNNPRTGISEFVFFQFFFNEKSDFEKAYLLAFLAIKSIIGEKPYCKMTNAFFLSRMDGKTASIEPRNLSPEIRKYANEYQTKKIRLELSINWGMSFYGKATKGFYASSKLNNDELIFQVLKNKQSERYQAAKAAKIDILNAELKAKLKLGIAPP